MKKPALPREDWDFSSCPEEERAACLHYEYAREYVHARPELVAKLTDKPRPSPYHQPLVFIYSDKRHPDSLPMICGEFPATPWLNIPAERRRTLIAQCQLEPEKDPLTWELLVDDDFDVALLQQLDEIREKLFAKWMQQNQEQHARQFSWHSHGVRTIVEAPELSVLCFGPKRLYKMSEDHALAVIHLDWRKSDRQLKEAFARLLQRRPRSREVAEATKKRTGGRGFAFDQLNQLGAKRLLKHYGNRENAVEAIEAAAMKPGQKQPYSDGDALGSAATKARAVLLEMKQRGRFRAFADLL